MKRPSRFNIDPGWQLLLKDMGIPIAGLLSMAGLPGDLFSRKEASVSIAGFFDLWDAFDKMTEGAELPLLIGKYISVEMFNPLIFASFCSPDLNTAIQRVSHYKRLCGPMNINVEAGEKETVTDIDCEGYTAQIPYSLGATDLVFFAQLARMATREHIEPISVQFADEPGDPDAYSEYFGVPVTIGDKYEIVFDAKDAAKPFLTENPAMWESFESSLKLRLADLEAGASTAQRVRSTLLESLPGGESSVEGVAGHLAMSKRTLQRKLSSEGESFQAILKEVRRELAEHYLTKSAIPQAEISFLLGFQDTNSFARAFSSWTGQTPGQFRNATMQ